MNYDYTLLIFIEKKWKNIYHIMNETLSIILFLIWRYVTRIFGKRNLHLFKHSDNNKIWIIDMLEYMQQFVQYISRIYCSILHNLNKIMKQSYTIWFWFRMKFSSIIIYKIKCSMKDRWNFCKISKCTKATILKNYFI